MKPEELRKRLRGVIAFPIPPLHADLSLEIAGLRKNLQQLLQLPVAGVVAAGGTGEGYSLTPDEHFEVVKATVEEVQGKIALPEGMSAARGGGASTARSSGESSSFRARAK